MVFQEFSQIVGDRRVRVPTIKAAELASKAARQNNILLALGTHD